MKLSNIFLGAAILIAAPICKAQTVVDTPFVHDPVMAYEGGKYYLYCTGHGITQMTSRPQALDFIPGGCITK